MAFRKQPHPGEITHCDACLREHYGDHVKQIQFERPRQAGWLDTMMDNYQPRKRPERRKR